MGKLPAYIVERDKAFYQWLAVRTEEKLLVELYSVIPFINGYGKNRKCFNDSLFELTDSKSAQKLLDMIDGDKRFKFMHYGHTKKILMLLDSYCKYLEEKEGVSYKASESVDKAAYDVQPAVEQPKVSEPALTASRAWSKYEVALLVETYLKAADNGYLRAAAEVLSHTLREWAVKQGKSIDATYRNVNGINMQLGTVQYCFTDGKKGLPNASTQIREMVNLYKTNRSEYEIVLTQAHQMLNKPGNEVAVLLQLPEYAPLRDELLKNGITTIEQLKVIDLWLFMNRHGVYSIRERQEIYKRVSAMIKPPESEKVRVQYCLRTKNGRSYYGNMPSTALASYVDSIAQNAPLSVRKLIDQRNNGIGQIALYSSIPPSGGIALANVRAYLDKAMTAKVALQHALWLGGNLKLTDLPVAIEENGQSVATAEAVSETKPEEQKTAETKQKKETGLQDYVKLYAGKTGEDWLFSMLSALKIKSEDKRKNQGCLWISGGHELDEFIKLCTAKGYKFHYKADGYKAFSGGPVWWTTDCVASVAEKVKVAAVPPMNQQKEYSKGIWSLKGDLLQYKSFSIKVPCAFDVLYEDHCDNSTVAFYPKREDSYATLQIWNVVKLYEKDEARKAFADYVTRQMTPMSSPKTEFASVKEGSPHIAYLTKISFDDDDGRGYEYIACLYNSLNKQSCMVQVFVDGNDDGKIKYDYVFNELIESVVSDETEKAAVDQQAEEIEQSVGQKPLSEENIIKENWSIKDGQLKFGSFRMNIPSTFDMLYEERCDDDTVAFYPSSRESHAILTVEKTDEAYAKDSGYTLLGKIMGEMIAIGSSPKVEFTNTEESETVTAMEIKFSLSSDGQVSYKYIGVLKNNLNGDSCKLYLFVNSTDAKKNDYDSAFKELIDSAIENAAVETENAEETKEDVRPEKPADSLTPDLSKKIWNLTGNKLQFLSYNMTIPATFDVLYNKLCDEETVAFYPERKNSYATLAIKNLDKTLSGVGISKMTVSKEQIKNAFKGIVTNVKNSHSYSKIESSEMKETSVLIAQISILTYMASAGREHVYCCLLFNKINKDCCSLQIYVDKNDEGYFNYGKAFNELVESALQGSTVEAANAQKDTIIQTEEKVSLKEFRRWLEQGFREYLEKQGLAGKTVSQYCQSIEAVERFIREKQFTMTLVNVDADEAQAAYNRLSSWAGFIVWNKQAHHQYSAALAKYIEFLKAKQTGMQQAEVKEPVLQKKEVQKQQSTATIREVVIRVLTENNRPMTTREIYTEIEKRGLYKFNSGNPCMIVDHTIRKSCVGIKMPNHTQDDVFDRVLDDSGVSKYYLLEWGKPYPDGESEVSEIEDGNNDAKPEYDDKKPATRAVNRWEEILSRYFPDGYIPDDFLSQLQAKTYWQEAYGEECPLDGAAIDEAIKACGTVRDGRVFVASEEEQGLITEMVAVILGILDKYSAVYRKNIYDRYEDKLAKCSIYTEEVMEQQLLEEAKGKFLCLWKFFVRKGHEPAIALDCRKVLRNHGGAMPAADVQKMLWFMPGDLVYHTLSTDKEALSLGNGVWMLAEHFPLTEEEAALIGDALDEYFIAHDFIQAADLLSYFQNRLPAIADNLKGLHFSAVFGIVKYYLGKRFSFTRAIISPLGAKIDFTDLFRNYASEHDQFTMDELAAFAKEIQIPIYFESLYSGGTVRINADEFVHKSKVSFDIEETDKVLESICPGDYMPFYAVSNAMLMHMPPCGYQWNGYLLLNYVYSFSKIFRASYKSIGKTGYYGAMVRRDCGTISNFRQLLVRVLTDDDTWKTVDDARELIVKRGYQALKDIGGIDKIVAQARENKLKDRG